MTDQTREFVFNVPTIDVFGSGRRLGRISKQLDDLPLAAGLILKNITFALPPEHDIRAPHPWLATVWRLLAAAGLIGGGLWLIVHGLPWIGTIGSAIAVWLFKDELRPPIYCIELGEGAVRLRHLIGTRTIPRSHIRSFDVITGFRDIYTVAFLGETEHVRLDVPGVDPFVVYAMAERSFETFRLPST